MPIRWLETLARFANRQTIAVLMVIFMVLTIAVFPTVSSQLSELSGGVGMIDMETRYVPSQVFQMISAYGEAGRSLYITTSLTADTLYPLDYALLFALIIIATYQRAFPKGRLMRFLVLVPFITALFDLLENATIITQLAVFPQPLALFAQAGSLFTTLKWCCLVITIVLVLVGWVGLLASGFRKPAGVK